MNPCLLFLPLFLFIASARAETASPELAFPQAQQAYEAGHFAEAAQLYGSIVSNGFAAAEVYFNQGNALYRAGATGPAIASYRRAQYQWPRHPDIRANLAIVRQQTGALVTEEPFWMHALGQLSAREWSRLGLLGYWMAGGAAVLYFLARRNRRALRIALIGIALALSSAAGYTRWHALKQQPEAVVLRSGVQALFAPLDNAVAHFALPEGSLVRVREESGQWLKIEVARQEGWVRSEDCERLSPR